MRPALLVLEKLQRMHLFLFALMMLGATRAQAAPITLNFEGAADLTPYGASTTSTFSGSVTWDTAAAPLLVFSGGANYPFLSTVFSINGTDHSALINQTAGTFLSVNDSLDRITIRILFNPTSINLGAGPDVGVFFGAFQGAPGSLSSAAIPTGLEFFTLATGSSQFTTDSFGSVVTGSLNATSAVPEPASLLLLGSGLAGIAIKARRRRKQQD